MFVQGGSRPQGPRMPALHCRFPDTWPLGALVNDVAPAVPCAGIVISQLGWGLRAGAGSVKQSDPANVAKDPSWSLFATARVN